MTEQQGLVLLETAVTQKRLPREALDVIERAGKPGQLALGMPIDHSSPRNLFLVTLMPDDSSSNLVVVKLRERTSIFDSSKYEVVSAENDDPRSNAEIMRIGHNSVREALMVDPRRDTILFRTRYLNGFELNPWGPIANAQDMTRKNYNPQLGTPLFQETVNTLSSVLAKEEEARKTRKIVTTATLIITDGGDTDYNQPGAIQAKDVAVVVQAMRVKKNHIVAGMAIEDGSTNVKEVLRSMGIEDRWILNPGMTQDEIRKAFSDFGTMARAAADPEQFQLLLESGFHRGLPTGQ